MAAISPRRSADALSLKVLERFERGLHEARSAGRALGEAERSRLTRVRDEIEQLLTMS